MGGHSVPSRPVRPGTRVTVEPRPFRNRRVDPLRLEGVPILLHRSQEEERPLRLHQQPLLVDRSLHVEQLAAGVPRRTHRQIGE